VSSERERADLCKSPRALTPRYFLAESPEAIADHVLALYSAKLLAYTKHDPEQLVIDLEKITPESESDKTGNKEGAVWIHTSQPGVTVSKGPGATVEKT
jgi:glutamate dehydrogenase